MKIFLPFSLIFAAVSISVAEERNYFTAAVLEHRYAHMINSDNDPRLIVRKNLQFYEKGADIAASKGADIILFPEYGLHMYDEVREVDAKYSEHIPNEYKSSPINPCNDKEQYEDRPALLTLSCMAKKHKMYVVANLVDTHPCPDISQVCHHQTDSDSCNRYENPSTPRRHRIFNTNVAFDRNGTIIARYHKIHLYHENFDTPATKEYVTFETEFGVFGTFICFDSVFEDAIHLVEDYKVDTVLFPTFWYDNILPFNAIEWQQSWALANKVNFLAANGHFPGSGTLGSGIYSKDHGALVYTYNPDSKTKLLVARVPLSKRSVLEPVELGTVTVITENDVYEVENEQGEHFPYQCLDKVVGKAENNLTDYRCIKSQTENYYVEKIDELSGKVKICDRGFCCSVKYEAETMHENYYIALFNGNNINHEHFEWREETCFLVRCDSLEGKECVTLPPTAETVFKYVELKAAITAKHVYATVSTSNNRLASKTKWTVERNEKTSVLQYRNSDREPLLKAGLLGRIYSQDPDFIPVHPDSCDVCSEELKI